MTLDIESGVRQTAGVESLAYDAAWVAEATNGVTFKVSVNGAEKAQVGAYGVLDWQEKRSGSYTVTAQAYQGGALVGELLSATFVVAGHDLVNAEVTVDTANVIYDGTAKCPAVVVRLGDKTLTEGVDYDLSYENNVAAGVGKVVITGMGKYVDEIERPFTIRPACCCPLDVQSGSRQTTGTEMLAVDPSWLGELGSTVWIAANGSSVGETNKPGTVAWSPIAPGEYTLTYSTYTGGVLQPETYTATFRVAGESVPFEIELDAVVYPYQGAAVVPKVKVTYHGVPLVEGKDYTLTLYNNDAVGVGRMVIAGKGAYSGTVEKSIYILASGKCTLDINDGIRIATGDETIRYSNVWSGDASSTARVTVKDVTAVEEQGTGDWVWTPGGVGLYEFKHTTMTGGVAGEVLAAQFYVPGTMTDATVSLAFTECLYDGSAACPKVVVTQGGKTLVEGLDYTVTYALNDRPGTGVAIVRWARGETYEATFTIRPAGCCFLNIESGIRDADAEEHLAYDTLWQGVTNAAYRIAVNGAELASGTGMGETLWTPQAVGAYTLTYQAFANNAKIGETWTASFRIAGKDLVNATITLPSDEVLYDGTALQPKPTIVYQGETLVEGVDYTLEYANNVDAGVATMTIHGAGRFVDVIEKTFVIRPAGVCSLDVESGAREAAAVELLNYAMAWDGATTAKIAVNGADLATVSGVGETAWRPTAAGDYTVTYRSYKGSAKTDTEWSAKFHITGQDLVNATITLDNEHILYDGTPREPKVTIVYGGKTLTEGVDYALSYANNVSSGVATMTITGMGDYHDVLERSFTIIPAGVCFLDIESGVREAKKRETLTYDWVWHGDAVTNTEMKILVQKSDAAYATTLASGLSDVGVQPWQPADKGQYTVMLRTYVDGYYLDSLDETAVFNAESQEEPFPEGAISVTGYEGKYDGNGHSISVTTTGIASPTITYARTEAGPFMATNPSFTNVCDETVWCVIAAEGYITQTNSAKVFIAKGSVGPGGGEEPGGGEVPPGGVSKFDVTAMYDGDGHTIDTNALVAAFKGSMVGEFEIKYGRAGSMNPPSGDFIEVALPVWTNVVATSLWYKVTSPNYNDFVHEAKVTITNRPIALASVAALADQTYTGAAIEPVPTVTDLRTLIGGTSPTDIITTDDYTVSYADNIDVGTAKVILTGQNNYAGVITNTFQIVPAIIPPGPSGAITATGYTNVYDGVAHGVTVTATGLVTTPTVQYRSNPTAEWQSASPAYKDVCDTQVWWKVSAPNYSDATGTIGVKITPRPVTLTSGTKTDFVYDGTPHEFSVMIISENPFAAGDGVATSNWATVTTVAEGQVDNTFDYAPLAGTKLENYDISVVTGKIAVVKGTIPPGSDPGEPDPSVDPTDPEQVKDPTIRFSPWDYIGVYDGAEHTVDTNAMKAAYADKFAGNIPSFAFATASNGTYGVDAPMFKDVVATSFWYKVSAANYEDVIHPCKVIVTNRCVTMKSADGTWAYDGKEHSTNAVIVTIHGDDGAAGVRTLPGGLVPLIGDETVQTTFYKVCSEVGAVSNDFSIAWMGTAKEDDYNVTLVTGKLEIVAAGTVTVTITGRVSNVVYDGTEKSVSGYDIVSISDSHYKTTDFKFTGNAATNGTDAGTYPMGLASSQFVNTNGNFATVTFNVTDGSLVIAKANHDMTGVAWNYGSPFTYDGSEKSVALTMCPATLTPSYTDNAKTAAGSYTAKVAFTYDTKNYNAPSAVADCAWEIKKGTVPPGEDPGRPDPSVDPTDPEQVKDPTIRFSPWDYVGMYDGAAHTVDTNAMKAAYVAVMGEGVTVLYAVGGGTPTLPWGCQVPMFKDVVATSFWYKVSASNYEDVIHPCKVIVTNRCVTMKSADGIWAYDGKEHSTNAVTVTIHGDDGAAGVRTLPGGSVPLIGDETVQTTFYKVCSEVGAVSNDFSIAWTGTAKEVNYNVSLVTGKLEIVSAGTVIVTITGHINNVVYDGTKKSVSGYDILSISDPLYKVTDFRFDGVASTNGTDAGTYPMGLASSQFVNTNGNFATVTFNVTDGSLVIAKADHDMTGVAWNYGSPFTYDGSEKSVALTTCPATLTPSYTDNAKIEAGSYTAKVSFTYDTKNYNAPSAVADCAWEIKKGTVGPGDDPGEPDPSVDPSDPEQVKDPTIRFSPWDYVGIYDGAEHTVDTNAMKAAYVAVMGEGVTVQYAVGGGTPTLPWGCEVPTYKDVVATSFWYKVSAANYEDVIHPCKVIITNRPVTVTSRDISKTFDGTPLTVTAEDISVTGGLLGDQPLPAGESFVYGDFGERTAVGTSPASFSVSAGPNTKLGNYDIHCVTGTITITQSSVVTVTIKGHTSNVVYDGTEKSVRGYDVVSISDPLYKVTDFEFTGVAATNGTDVGTYPMGLASSQFANTNGNFSAVTFVVTDGALRIDPCDIAHASIAPIAAIEYAGEPVRPVPTVTDGDPSIITTGDYTVSYANNNAPGTATLTLTGRGNYTGTKSANFTITASSPKYASLTGAIAWKLNLGSGCYTAQLKLVCTNGFESGISNLRYLFADRTSGTKTIASLWDSSARSARATTTWRDATYRYVSLDAAKISRQGVSVVYGVKDVSQSKGVVAKDECTIELYVPSLAAPSGYEGLVVWTSGGSDHAMVISVSGGAKPVPEPTAGTAAPAQSVVTRVALTSVPTAATEELGLRNVFTSKDRTDKVIADAVLATWKGTYAMAWPETDEEGVTNGWNTLSIKIGARGRTVVAGILANGRSASASAQMLVGDEWCRIAVSSTRKDAALDFVLWLSRDGEVLEVEGASGVHVGPVGNLAGDGSFRLSTEDLADLLGDDVELALGDVLPECVPITLKGVRWVVPLAGAVRVVNKQLDYSRVRDNPAALRLTFVKSTGRFTGSFRIYLWDGKKLGTVSAVVKGIVVNGVGYGTTKIGKYGTLPVLIGPDGSEGAE